MIRALRVFACAALASFAVGTATADVIPPPNAHTDIQKSLIGVWKEKGCMAPKQFGGHGCNSRVIAFGETEVTVLNFFEGAPNMYRSSYEHSDWSAKGSADGVTTLTANFSGMTEVKLKISGDTLTILGNDMFRDSEFTRLTDPAR